MINQVEISKNAKKDLMKVPVYIAVKLKSWVDDVEKRGIEQVRKTKGYHDELLKGKRKGERSIRLSKSYRAMYLIRKDGSIEFVSIEEINKHDYKKK